MKLTKGIFISVVAAACMSAYAPAHANAVYIVNTTSDTGSGPCFEFTNDNFVLQATACQGKLGQQWVIAYIQDYAPREAYVFQNRERLTCIAVENDSMANAAPLVERPCDFSNPSQHFWRASAGSATYPLVNGFISTKSKLINGRSGKCIDTWPARNGYGYVQQYDCKSDNIYRYQMFTFHWTY